MKLNIIILILMCCIYSCGNESTFQNRFVSDIPLEVHSFFEYEDGNIIRMWADDDLIYISSDPDNAVKLFDYSGNLSATFGKNGEAPWENGTVWGFGKDSDAYWVHDYPKMALKKYALENDSMLFFRRFETKHNVLYVGDNRFLIPRFDVEDGVFYISLYDAIDDTFIKEIDICKLTNIFDKLPPFGDYTFQGDFCKNDEGQAIFFCMFNSSFFFMDTELDKIKHYTDIRALPISKPIVSNQQIRLDPMNCGILTGTLDEEYVYFISPKYKETMWYNVKDFLLDIYDINSKEYIKSFDIPLWQGKYPPLKISKTSHGLVVAYYGGIIVVYNDFSMHI
ncbi:hypothetical protein AwDysgo_21490 [Bacteroidales bacterium]|nr:hypothetical protein AwDysgo_21490 [Bacteroidales bacterium]